MVSQSSSKPTTNKPIRVMIVDDHPVVRLGLNQLIQQDPGLEVSGEAERVDEAIQKLDQALPDAVIVDLALPDTNGIDLIHHLKHHWVGVKIIVVSTYPETAYGPLAMEAGGDVYINKHEAMDQIIQAIYAVCAPPQDQKKSPNQQESHWFG